MMELDTEFWFGVEICVYVIFPLLLLTVFGTVNCCKVSMSSRMLPTKQVQAIKINIAVTVSTNIALFLFLVQVSTQFKIYFLKYQNIIFFRSLLIFGRDSYWSVRTTSTSVTRCRVPW